MNPLTASQIAYQNHFGLDDNFWTTYPTGPKKSKQQSVDGTLQQQWHIIALNVLAGHYNKCDSSTAESIIIGLSHYPGEPFTTAVEALKKMKGLK